MVTIRWWVVFTIVPVLLGVGVGVGYFSERMLQSVSSTVPAPSSSESPFIFRSIQRDPNDPSDKRDPMMEAGAAFMTRVNKYKERLDEAPDDLEALIFLGNANYDITRFDKAVEYYERVLGVDPANFHIRTDLATSYYGMGDIDRALKELRKALEQNPRHETALYNLGAILLDAKKDNEGAINAWEKLLTEHPNSLKNQGLGEKIRELKLKN